MPSLMGQKMAFKFGRKLMALIGQIMCLEGGKPHITTNATNIVFKLNLGNSLRNAERKEGFSNVVHHCKKFNAFFYPVISIFFKDIILLITITSDIYSRNMDIFLMARKTLHVAMISIKEIVIFAQVTLIKATILQK